MASLLTDPLFEISGRAPPPCKNFYFFSVTKTNVIWRWWIISMRAVNRYSKPGELKESLEDFLKDKELQSQISWVFGPRVLEYSKSLSRGHFDYLERLPDSLVLRIISYLELEDVGRLEQTSRRFKQLCASEEFWEQALRQRWTTVSAEVQSVALEVGWRGIFFTGKLQLQKLIGRRRRMRSGRTASDSDVTEENSSDEGSGANQLIRPERESNLHG